MSSSASSPRRRDEGASGNRRRSSSHRRMSPSPPAAHVELGAWLGRSRAHHRQRHRAARRVAERALETEPNTLPCVPTAPRPPRAGASSPARRTGTIFFARGLASRADRPLLDRGNTPCGSSPRFSRGSPLAGSSCRQSRRRTWAASAKPAALPIFIGPHTITPGPAREVGEQLVDAVRADDHGPPPEPVTSTAPPKPP